MSFKKPTVALREAKVAVHQALGLNVPADTRRGYTDTMEFLSAGVLIGYKKRAAGGYPTAAQKAAAVAGASLARAIMRKANDELAAITFLRRNESPLMQSVLATHFQLVANTAASVGGTALKDNIVDKPFSLKGVREYDRRWVINKIRENMLSISFHINTGVYLIDTDFGQRDMEGGQNVAAAPNAGTEAYVSPAKKDWDSNTWRYTNAEWTDDLNCGFRHGEIHISLANIENYSPISYARVIIHEASHKYLNTDDNAYCHEGTYAALSLTDKLKNADSYAWAAVSLYCGGLKMGTTGDYPGDWMNCTKP